jgi:hypothetical protein
MDLEQVIKLDINEFKKYIKYNTSPNKLNLLSNIINNKMLENKNKIIKLCENKTEHSTEYQKCCSFIDIINNNT